MAHQSRKVEQNENKATTRLYTQLLECKEHQATKKNLGSSKVLQI
jgi:hypothetical protein